MRASVLLLVLACSTTNDAVPEPSSGNEAAATGQTTDEANGTLALASPSHDEAASTDRPTENATETDTEAEMETETEPGAGAGNETVPAQVTRPTTILAPSRPGRISMDRVRRIIHEHQPEVSACYEEGLSRNRNLRGQANVRFLVGPRGQVEDAEVFSSTLDDIVVEDCIANAMRTWEFPRPRPRGRSVLLTYPYELSTR